MKKIFSLLFATILSVSYIVAQKDYLSEINYIFDKLDKSRIETGLLSDYGTHLIELKYYDGVLSDSNFVNISTFYKLYCGLYSSKINTNANKLLLPDTVISRIKNAICNEKTVSVAMMQFDYNSFREDAIELGLLKVVDNQIYDFDLTQSPYNTKQLFVVAPKEVIFSSPTVTFVFKPELWFTNLDQNIKSIEIRFGEKGDFVPVSWNVPISHTFSGGGVQNMAFKLTRVDNSIYWGHTQIYIEPIEKPLPKNRKNITINSTSEHSGGTLQIRYATSNLTINGKDTIAPTTFKKTLIVADAFDPSNIMTDKGKIDIDFFPEYVLNLIGTLGYDIVYVDNKDGLDDIRRNAKLFQEAIEYVNAHKAEGNYENVVLGLSMGGLVARYALKKMENANINHNVCKNISFDSPHRGANVPVGIQAMVRYIENLDFNIFWVITVANAASLDDRLSAAIKLINKPASKQLLIYYMNKNYNYDNSTHNSFMQEYQSLGVPQNCQNIAIANGSNNGTTIFPPYSQILSLDSTIHAKDIFSFLYWLVSPAFLLTNYPEMFLNIIPGSSDLVISAQVNALPNQSVATIYDGKLILKKKLFGFIPAQVTMAEKVVKSASNMLPIDGAPGGMYDATEFLDNGYIKYLKQKQFCFIATVSALDLKNWQSELTSNLSNVSSDTYYYDYGYSPFENYFYQPINNSHTNILASYVFLKNQLTIGCTYPKKDKDLYIKDNSLDNGIEPNISSQSVLASPDIWLEDLDGNKVSVVTPYQQYNVCVKIRNRSNEASYGTAKIFIHWNMNNINNDWWCGWKDNRYPLLIYGQEVIVGDVINENGTTIPSIGANNSEVYVHKELWTAPCANLYQVSSYYPHLSSIFMHKVEETYALLARINDGNIIPNERNCDTDLTKFVRESNNIAVNKNFVLAGEFSRFVALGWVDRPFDLLIQTPLNNNGQLLTKFADLYILPDDILLNQIKENPKNCEGLKITEKGLLLSSNRAVIKNLHIDANSLNGLGVFIEFFSKEPPESSDFKFSISQIINDTTIVDEIPFTVVRDMNRYFAVQAHAEAFLNEKKLFLRADEIGEPAKYLWYDNTGKEIGNGRELNLPLPDYSQWYKLEVIAEKDNYKDIDSVYVNIPLGYIVNITPNPTNDDIRVEYFLSKTVNSAYLLVMNNFGNTVMQENLDINQKEKYISLKGQLTGTYYIILVANDLASDSKILIKY